jgi:hypothetical protein
VSCGVVYLYCSVEYIFEYDNNSKVDVKKEFLERSANTKLKDKMYYGS